jgi:hypothetical protein
MMVEREVLRLTEARSFLLGGVEVHTSDVHGEELEGDNTRNDVGGVTLKIVSSHSRAKRLGKLVREE